MSTSATNPIRSNTKCESKPNKTIKKSANKEKKQQLPTTTLKRTPDRTGKHSIDTRNNGTAQATGARQSRHQNKNKARTISIATASRTFGIPVATIKQAIKDAGISQVQKTKKKTAQYNYEELTACLKKLKLDVNDSEDSQSDTDDIQPNASKASDSLTVDANNNPTSKTPTTKRKKARSAAKQLRDAEKARIYEGVNVAVRERLQAPETAVLYTGPTNSGKTFQAIEDLKRHYEADPDGIYVYAGPLRMLAYEVYQKLSGIYGEDNVGFITGEEQINPGANIKCCTVEMAPTSGKLIVLDEAHWMVDDDRGQYWTNLLIGGAYTHFRVITATEAEQAISDLLSDADDLEICECHRMTSLVYGGTITPQLIPPRTAVVAFSRKTVYAVAKEISKRSSLSVGVLYGALPLRVRQEQIRKYISGEYDVMVTTDVIGHGINLPIDNVVFAETEKYDGHIRRPLRKWEASQIAGRAGRYGYADTGTVYILGGLGWLTPSSKVAKNGVRGGSGQEPTDLRCRRAFVTPQLEDLRITEPQELACALHCWIRKADAVLEDRAVCAASMSDRKELISAIAAYSGAPCNPWSKSPNKWRMTLDQLWTLSGAPLDPNSDVLVDIVAWANSKSRETSTILEVRFDAMKRAYESYCSPVEHYSDSIMRVFESTYKSAQQMDTVFNLFETLGTLDVDRVRRLMRDIEQHMINCLDGTYDNSGVGQCRMCGAPCAPWFSLCSDCYHMTRDMYELYY